MKIIDAHVHLIEHFTGYGSRGESRAGGAIRWANGETVQMAPPELSGTGFLAEEMLRLMDENNVEAAVAVHGSGYGFQNDYICEAVRKYPGRFIGSGAFDPYCACAGQIVRRLTDELGFQIIKLEISDNNGLRGYHPTLRLLDGRLDFFWARAEERGLAVILDIGALATNERHIGDVLRLLDAYPHIRIVIAHLLMPSLGQDELLEERLARLAGADRLWLDLSTLPYFTEPDPYPYGAAARYTALAARIVGEDRLLWGSDAPAVLVRETYPRLIGYLGESGLLSQEQLEKIFYYNAKEAFQID